MITELPQRKPQRLKNFDYGTNGLYFVTICTQNRISLFGQVGDGKMRLNAAGEMIGDALKEIPEHYPGLCVETYIVMPNHVHAIIEIGNSGTAQGPFPTVSLPNCVKQFKTLTTKRYIDGVGKGTYPPFEQKIWQKSFHDHVIRDRRDHEEIWDYIVHNAAKWEEDRYHKDP